MNFDSVLERLKNVKMVKVRPSLRTIIIDGEIFTLAFPYMYFFKNTHVFWSLQDIDKLSEEEKEDMEISVPLLPNVFECGDICWGRTAPDYEEVVATFFGGSFATSEGGAYNLLEDTKLLNFNQWSKMSKNKKPLDVFDGFKSPKLKFLIKDLI